MSAVLLILVELYQLVETDGVKNAVSSCISSQQQVKRISAANSTRKEGKSAEQTLETLSVCNSGLIALGFFIRDSKRDK